jgi:two-component system heavy metal sensor histidine kinase CusS
MQTRLTLRLGAIALLVSSVAGASLFFALEREVTRQERTEIQGKLELINHLINMQGRTQDLRTFASTLDSMRAGHGNLGIWIVDDQERAIYGAPLPTMLAHLPQQEILLQTQDGVRMRGMRLGLNDRLPPGAYITVAVGTRANLQFLYAYGSALLLICALWVGSTVGLGAWAIRRSFAPLKRLSELAARIQPDNLSQRLPLQGIDRELHDLVHAFNRSLERLQSTYQQMEGFSADVAHELRTPLATLINGTPRSR